MDIGRIPLYPAAGAVLLAAVGGGAGPPAAHAQTSDAPTPSAAALTWMLVVDGTPADWPGPRPDASPDSVRAVAQRVLRRLRRDGYYYARLDSAVVDTARRPPTVRLYARRGPRVTVGGLRIKGTEAVPAADLRRRMDTEVGEPLNPRRLEADMQVLLDRYERAGHPLAQIRVERAALDSTRTRLRLTLRVEEGPALWLKRIETNDDARTNPALLAHLARLSEGDPLTNYDPEALRRRVAQSDLFRSVGTPTLAVDAEGGAVVRIPVEEAPPGSFDLVLGYLPAAGPGGGGQFVGSGHLRLRHLFGGGRRANITLDRRPGRASLFDLSVSDPYAFGWPLRVQGTFRGEQRDSTFGERSYGGEVGYRFGDGVELVGSLHREVTQPGPAGARLRDGRQRIPRAQALFYGLGVRYRSLDRPVSPRRGLQIDVQVEQGRKDRRFRRVVADDTTRVEETLRQERLRAALRTYTPLFDRQVLVVGGDAAVLRSDAYDRSDLFRLGGAESLRGYDEDRFLGNVTARGLVEYRVQLDRRSYLYAFGDLGYVRRPALQATSARQSWRPGYGLGVQLSTGIGLLTTTYALNPDVATPVNGRVHVGLSVDL